MAAVMPICPPIRAAPPTAAKALSIVVSTLVAVKFTMFGRRRCAELASSAALPVSPQADSMGNTRQSSAKILQRRNFILPP